MNIQNKKTFFSPTKKFLFLFFNYNQVSELTIIFILIGEYLCGVEKILSLLKEEEEEKEEKIC